MSTSPTTHAVTTSRDRTTELFRPSCTCGWRGSKSTLERFALLQGEAHLQGVSR